MNRKMKAVAGLVLACALAACGGGGGSPGTTGTGGGTTNGSTGGTGGTGGTGTTTTDPTLKVADFVVLTDKSSIQNNGTDSARVTVQAVDANRNIVSGATVVASSDANSVFVPGSTTTDATGTFTGTVNAGADKTDRDITVSITINGITKRVTVHVGGSKLVLAANPSTVQPGQQVTLTANLKDSGANPIVGQTVTFSSTTAGITNRTATTSITGDASITVAAPGTAGVFAISATGGGTSAADLQLQVLSVGGSVPVATIPANSAPSLAASPNVLSANSVGSTANKSVLRFLLLDAANNPVPNVRVRFEDLTTGLPRQGASITSENTTLFTDASGSATAQYIAGQNSSSTNGVRIRACYSATDLTATDVDNCRSGVAGSKFVDVTLTVAGQALAVSIGDDNLLQSVNGTYIKRFAVTVADSAGRAVANAPVDISVDLTHYGKGAFEQAYAQGDTSRGLNVVQALGLTQSSQPLNADPAFTGVRSWCPNEDVNRNGIVDPTTAFGGTTENYNGSVDGNGQPTLEPRKADLLISYDNPVVTTTDANGLLIIKVQYSQRFASWLAYNIRVTASVAGSQGTAERLFVTDFLQADLLNGSFRTPPYGSHACSVPN
jgi:hypothetical protein